MSAACFRQALMLDPRPGAGEGTGGRGGGALAQQYRATPAFHLPSSGTASPDVGAERQSVTPRNGRGEGASTREARQVSARRRGGLGPQDPRGGPHCFQAGGPEKSGGEGRPEPSSAVGKLEELLSQGF